MTRINSKLAMGVSRCTFPGMDDSCVSENFSPEHTYRIVVISQVKVSTGRNTACATAPQFYAVVEICNKISKLVFLQSVRLQMTFPDSLMMTRFWSSGVCPLEQTHAKNDFARSLDHGVHYQIESILCSNMRASYRNGLIM